MRLGITVPTLVGLLAVLAPLSLAQASRLGGERQDAIGERLTDLGQRLLKRRAALKDIGTGARSDVLLEEQATELTEYRALELGRFLRHRGENSRDCEHAREERARELRNSRGELAAARGRLTSAPSAADRKSASESVRHQRERLHREIQKTEEILEHVCGERGPEFPHQFVPPGHAKQRGLGHHFAPGKGHQKFADADGLHEHDTGAVPPGHAKSRGKGKKAKKVKKKGKGGQ